MIKINSNEFISKNSVEFIAELRNRLERSLCVPSDVCGEIHGYCENEACQIREVDIEFKEIDTNISKPVKCPMCRKPLNILSVIGW